MKTEKLPIITMDDIRQCNSQDGKYGVSLYEGVLIVWDEDRDERIFTFIDELPWDIRCGLVMVGECKGGLDLSFTSELFLQRCHIEKQFEVEGDIWTIYCTKIISTTLD